MFLLTYLQALNEKKAIILKRIRSQARSAQSNDSLSSSPLPRTSTPLPRVKIRSGSSVSTEAPSREGTVFTPTADKELEAILNQQEEGETTSGTASASASTKSRSRPATEEGRLDETEQEEENEEEAEKIEVAEGYKGTSESGGEKKLISAESAREKVISQITIIEPIDEEGESQKTSGRPNMEEVNFQANNEQTAAPSSGHALSLSSLKQQLTLPRSKEGLLSPTGSFIDMKGSRMSAGQFSDRRSLISRDSIKERQRMNIEVNSVYADLDARYSDMLQLLRNIDKGLNTKGSSAESSTVASLSGSNGPSVNLINVMNDDVIKGFIEELTHKQGQELDVEGLVNGLNGAEEVGEGKDSDGYGNDHNTRMTICEKGKEISDDPMTITGSNDKERVNGDMAAMESKEMDGEWKSFADSLSEDPSQYASKETSYPSYEAGGDNNATNSYLSTTGFTAHASEYDEIGEENASDNDSILSLEMTIYANN